jgi:hypothetical protein
MKAEVGDQLALPRRGRRRRWILLGVVIAAVCALALAGAMAFEARTLRVHPVTFVAPDVPPAFDGLRIAFASDIHQGPFFSLERVRTLVERINALHPDVIVLGGDYFYRGDPSIAPVFAELARFQAPLGVYAVLGNQDVPWADDVRAALATAGIGDLDGTGVWLRRGDARLRLCGLGPVWEDTEHLPAALDGATAQDAVVLLVHDPGWLERVGSPPVDLALAGHTHGGQVTLFGVWAPYTSSRYGQKYRAGLVRSGPVPVFVTTGVGTTVLPLRWFARPEIVLLTLRR